MTEAIKHPLVKVLHSTLHNITRVHPRQIRDWQPSHNQ